MMRYFKSRQFNCLSLRNCLSPQISVLIMGRAKRIWCLSPMRAAKVQASLRIRAVSPEPPLLAHTSSESRGTFRQKTRSLAPLNGWACAVKMCHDGMLEDTNSLVAALIQVYSLNAVSPFHCHKAFYLLVKLCIWMKFRFSSKIWLLWWCIE